jgi:hypothetical protein
MVVSQAHRYVFVEVPHTASTALSDELCRHYDGTRVLYKHASYNEFWETASPAERRYRVFAGVRNPMDEAVSLYYKVKHNHKGNYTNPRARVENGGWLTPVQIEKYRFVTENDASFADYFLRYYRQLHTNRFLDNRRDYAMIIRFEHLQEDFSRMLDVIGVEQMRPLPAVNPTQGKDDFVRHYTPATRDRAVRVLGPFMRQWGYRFPREWGRVHVPLGARLRYRFRDAVAVTRATLLRERPLLRTALAPLKGIVRRATSMDV